MKAIFTVILSLITLYGWSQAPAVSWDKTYGTAGNESAKALVKTQDGGFLMGGEFSSSNSDFLVIKVDANGIEEWRKTYDNNGNYDQITSMAQNIDGGFVLGGYTYSTADYNYDYWVVKINANGVVEWTVQLNGNSSDQLQSIQIDPLGDIIVGGYSVSSAGGDKSENSRGGNDMWVVKLNNNGIKVWDKTIGGSSDDLLMTIKVSGSGSYLLGGYSYSGISGEKSEASRGGADYWIVSMNANGNINWNKTLGGSNNDILAEIEETSNGEIILAGQSQSQATGDKSQNTTYQPFSYTYCYQQSYTCGTWGSSTCYRTVCYTNYVNDTDYWVIKLNSAGQKIWDKDFGGSGFCSGTYCNWFDAATNVSILNGDFLVAGYSVTNAGFNKSENSRGGNDAWLIKLDNDGNKLWDKTIGGNSNDDLASNESVVITSNSKVTFLANSYSGISGDKTSPALGGSDYWLVSLVAEPGDVTPPVISGIPTDIYAENDPGSCYTLATWTPPVATDNKGVVSFTSNYEPGDLFGYGANQVIYVATDAAGNSTQASFYVYVQDNEAPTFAYVPDNIVVEVTDGSNSAIVELPEIVALDNCEEIFLISFRSDGEETLLTDPYPIGVTTITYEAYDLAENLATLSFTVTVKIACSNVTAGGSIEGNESNCGSFDPTLISSSALPTGGSGELEYIWLATTHSDFSSVVILENSNSSTYDPAPITQTTWYRRTARRAGCTEFIAESNWVKKEVFQNVTNAGIIASDQQNCGAFTPTLLTSVAPALAAPNQVIEYQWMSSTVDVPNTQGNPYWKPIAGATAETYQSGALNQSTYFIRCARVQGCSFVGATTESNKVSIQIFENVTNAGTIAADQKNCGPFTPALLTSIAPALAAPNQIIEYQWMSSTVDVPNTQGNPYWKPIAGATAETYQSGALSQSTYFIRCARVQGCSFVGATTESNKVSIQIFENVTNAGTIATDQKNCGPFTPALLTSVAPALAAPSQIIEYQWMSSTVDVPNTQGNPYWKPIAGATAETYQSGALNQSTYFIRCARVQGCSFVGATTESNKVSIRIFENVTNAGTIAADQKNCGPFTPALLTSVAPALAAPSQIIEYQWMSSTVDVPNTQGNPYWKPIAGATAETYQSGALSQSTYFIRCARVQGCSFVGATTESNKVTITVLPVPMASLTAVNGTCLNGNVGSATVNITGGLEPFTYKWSTGATTVTIDKLVAGEYSVVVTDANQCNATTAVSITTENCIPVLDLNLTSECYEDPAERKWRITNPNEFEVEIIWQVYGTTQTGSLTAIPGVTYFTTLAQAGPNTTIIEWLNEKGETKKVTKAASNKPCCLPSASTDRVVDFNQGKRRDGKEVIWYRSNPDNALGKADAKDSPQGGIRFVSLGFGGSITLEFENQLCDKPGNDLRVYETSYGNPMFALYPEQAEVFVSQDGIIWKSLGRTNTTTPSTNCRVKLDTDFDISSAYSWIQFVRVVDVTNPNAKMLNPSKCTPLPVTVFNKASDGFDLDAIESLENGKPFGSPSGRDMADTGESEEAIFISNPSAMIYPNPVERELLIDLEEEEEFVMKEDEAVHLEIMDMKGIRHKSLNHNLDNGLLIRCDVSSLSPGLYLARTQTNGITRVYKFVKQ